MHQTISAEESKKRFSNLIDDFVTIVKEDFFSKETQENETFKLILNKMVSNLTAANLLCAHHESENAKILIRSAYESTVLFAYLQHFPQEIEHYKLEGILNVFLNNCHYYLMNFIKEEKLKELYSSLEPKIIQKYELEKCFEKHGEVFQKKIEKLLKNTRSRGKFERIHILIDELRKHNYPYQKVLDLNLHFYHLNSQIAHGSYKNILDYTARKISFNNAPEKYQQKIIDESKDCWQQTIYILWFYRESLFSPILTLSHQSFYQKARGFYQYLGISMPENLIQPVHINTNIIQPVVFNPI